MIETRTVVFYEQCLKHEQRCFIVVNISKEVKQISNLSSLEMTSLSL